MLRSIIAAALVVLFCTAAQARTQFVPGGEDYVLWDTKANAIDNTNECMRMFHATQASTVPCTDWASDWRPPYPGVVTKIVYYLNTTTTPTAGIDCDLSLRLNNSNVGTVWTLDTESPGDTTIIQSGEAFNADERLQIHVVNGSGGTCNQASDAWITVQIWGYYDN